MLFIYLFILLFISQIICNNSKKTKKARTEVSEFVNCRVDLLYFVSALVVRLRIMIISFARQTNSLQLALHLNHSLFYDYVRNTQTCIDKLACACACTFQSPRKPWQWERIPGKMAEKCSQPSVTIAAAIVNNRLNYISTYFEPTISIANSVQSCSQKIEKLRWKIVEYSAKCNILNIKFKVYKNLLDWPKSAFPLRANERRIFHEKRKKKKEKTRIH